MFGGSWRIGRFGGIDIRVDASWAVGVLLITYLLYLRVGVAYPRLGDEQALALGALASVLFFGSVLVHELAHAGMARLRGIEVSGITLFLFGGATAARLDDRGPGDEFLVTVVGPGSSLALAGLFWAISQTGAIIGFPVAGAFGYVGWVNLLLAGFNIVPGFPLDGGRMLRSILWRVTGSMERATRIAARAGQGVGLLLIAFGLVRAAQGESFSGIWLAAIGWMLFGAARRAIQEHGLRRALAGAVVADAMGPPPTTIPAGISLSEALDRYLMGHEPELFPVTDGGRVVGLLDFKAASRVGRKDPLRPVREAMLPVQNAVVLRPETKLDDALERLGNRGGALVMDAESLVGSITRDDMARWITARTAS
jgi:Zn-dependent protease